MSGSARTQSKLKLWSFFPNWFCFLSNEGPVLELVLCGVSLPACHRQSGLIGKRLLGSILLTRHILKSPSMVQIIIARINFENCCWRNIWGEKQEMLIFVLWETGKGLSARTKSSLKNGKNYFLIRILSLYGLEKRWQQENFSFFISCQDDWERLIGKRLREKDKKAA